MSKEVKERDKIELQREQLLSQEDESEPEEKPDHPGWLALGEILKNRHPVFAKSMFMIGYHFSSNIYVLAGDYLTIVDPGNDYTAFLQFFPLGFKPTDIKKIVLTHGHRDHSMGTFELLRYPSIMERKDLEFIIHEAGPIEFKEMIRQTGHAITELKGGETLELSGFNWEVIRTPGHTIDGISLYHAPTKTAFTGDVVLPHAIADVDKNAGGRLDHYLYGLKSLMKRDIDIILPGHGVPMALDGHKAIEQTYQGIMMKILEIEPGSKISWLQGAKKLAEKGLLEEVLYCCDQELAHRPDDSEALQLMASCLSDLGRCEESIEVFDRILAQQPNNAHALLGKGHALLGLGKHEESLRYFDDVLGMDPNVKEAHIYKGMALYLSGRYDEAMDIEFFRDEFVGRFREQISTLQEKEKQG
ncbi:MAG: MBL fold metallo-hydrolase [Deltaproteobacteria bacterium]|nr:MBL fold metallo-hydrolase [Deltaproteobacteria bacterium]MBW2072321.1 MBL fold metallo-hydrolase [Deltaproteobacteria bacterium]